MIICHREAGTTNQLSRIVCNPSFTNCAKPMPCCWTDNDLEAKYGGHIALGCFYVQLIHFLLRMWEYHHAGNGLLYIYVDTWSHPAIVAVKLQWVLEWCFFLEMHYTWWTFRVKIMSESNGNLMGLWESMGIYGSMATPKKRSWRYPDDPFPRSASVPVLWLSAQTIQCMTWLLPFQRHISLKNLYDWKHMKTQRFFLTFLVTCFVGCSSGHFHNDQGLCFCRVLRKQRCGAVWRGNFWRSKASCLRNQAEHCLWRGGWRCFNRRNPKVNQGWMLCRIVEGSIASLTTLMAFLVAIVDVWVKI